ncbi:hypothetical protein DFH06DRAFT_1147097 [Mycena polygramma]|nr:hypothetical protein DFH06DRAFT_1147097 [Mycena polygramma]
MDSHRGPLPLLQLFLLRVTSLRRSRPDHLRSIQAWPDVTTGEGGQHEGERDVDGDSGQQDVDSDGQGWITPGNVARNLYDSIFGHKPVKEPGGLNDKHNMGSVRVARAGET